MNERVLCFGELLLRLGAPGRELLLQSRALEVHYAGAEANVAVSLAHLGHETAMVSVVPENALAEACIGELRRHGVDTTYIRRKPGRLGLYFLTTGAMQRPTDVLYDRAHTAFALAPSEVYDWSSALNGCHWLHISGITPAVSQSAADSAIAAAAAAVERGVRISFDCNFRPRVWGERAREAPSVLRRLCSHADLIFGEDRDFDLILGAEAGSSGTARAFASFPRLTWIACTRRSRESVDFQQLGASLRTRSGEWTSGPHTLSNIVDRIGAGDAFAAGVLHGLISGKDPQRTIDFALAACRYKHSIPGDFNVATAAEIDAVLANSVADVRR